MMFEPKGSHEDADLRPVLVGKHRPEGDDGKDGGYHAKGFGIALQNALDSATKLLFDEGLTEETTFEVAVRFEATIRLRNPGAIDEYRAVVTSP